MEAVELAELDLDAVAATPIGSASLTSSRPSASSERVELDRDHLATGQVGAGLETSRAPPRR